MSRAARTLALVALPLAASAAGAQQPDSAPRATPPAPGPLRRYDFPQAQRFTLANGTTVVLLERHTLPVVTAQIIVDAGALREPAAKAGLASLTGSLLSEGTRTLSGAQLAERMDRLGADFFTYGDRLTAGAAVTALTTVFPDAFALAATTVTAPSFPAGEFRRRQGEALAAIEQRRARVEGVAPEVLARALFDSTVAYGRPSEGTPATVSALTRDDVARWHASNYAPATTTVLLVGDITAAAARQAAERAFGGWRAAVAARPAPALAARPVTAPRLILVDRPGSVQSAIAVGQAAIAATDPDYVRLVAVNQVLGGGFNSRINMNLRERHGFTYGAFSNFQPGRGTGGLSIVSPVRTNATDSALVEAVAEWRRIARDSIPTPELRGAVNNLVSSFPSSVQTVQGIRQRVATAIGTGLPLDFYATYRDRLAAVTPAEAHAAAARVLKPDAPTIVVVGDLATVEPRIRALNLGTVEVWDLSRGKVR